MESQYWKDQETKPNFKQWLSEYDGCLMCACDHGCNQWIKEQRTKIGLYLRITTNNGRTNLDKLAQLPLERANKIWYRIQRWESRRFNRELREQEKKILANRSQAW